MRYDKLVRDKIPEIIKGDNKEPITHIANDIEYWQKLKEKLIEESEEFAKNEKIEELVDILEVIESISTFKNINLDDLERIRKDKAEKRGKFEKRIVLDEAD